MEQSDTNMYREYEQYINKHVVVMLKDNTVYYGTFKSFDQYNSITLNYTVERIFCNKMYGEVFHGLVVVRGDVIVLIGISKNDYKGYKKMEYKEVQDMISSSV